MTESERPEFLFLCLEPRRAAYDMLQAEFGDLITWAEDPSEVLVRCMLTPPSAVLVDVPSAIRCNKHLIAQIFDLRIDLPAMRVQAGPTGPPRGMCFDPPRQGNLQSFLRELASGQGDWRSRTYQRSRLRVSCQCRVLCRVQGEERFELRTNTLDISGGGCFLACYDPLPLGTAVTLEFVDSSPKRCPGTVMWTRAWESGEQIPGMGIRFESDDVVSVVGVLIGRMFVEAAKARMAAAAPGPAARG